MTGVGDSHNKVDETFNGRWESGAAAGDGAPLAAQCPQARTPPGGDPQGCPRPAVFRTEGNGRGNGPVAHHVHEEASEGGTTLAEPGDITGVTSEHAAHPTEQLTRADMARRLGTPSGRPDPASVLPRPSRPLTDDGKIATAVRETGNMFATAFEALRQAPFKGRPGWPSSSTSAGFWPGSPRCP